MASTTFTVRGIKVRTQSHFRFQIVTVQPDRFNEHGSRIAAAGARIVGRSDSLASARSRADQMRGRVGEGVSVVVVDATNGDEVTTSRTTTTTSEGGHTMATSKAKAKAKQTALDQGVPAAYCGPTGNFRMGMDARLKSDLINTILGTPNEQALATFTPQEAKKLLAARGWNQFLVKAREGRARKARAKAKVEKAES